VYRRIAAIAASLVLSGACALSLGAQSGVAPQGASGPASGGTAGAQASAGGSGGLSQPVGVDVSIRFYDKRLYYPEGSIPIKVTISNNTARTYRFKLTEDRVYSLSFEARTPANRALDVADDYKRTLASTRPVFYREMAVEPGEEYSFVEDLARYVHVVDPGSYSVRATFYPELVQSAPGVPQAEVSPIASNVLLLAVRPSPALPPASDLVSPDTGEILRPEALPPDEVVSRTIIARQRSRWNEFFLYLDLESLMTRDETRRRAYDRESDEGRRRLLERYRADLRTNVVDLDIVTIPASFEIIDTRYSTNRGTVRVIERFDYHSYMMVKEYDYELVRKDNIWYIVGYSVLNKGTE
jgi:hypothetical protein